jgi:hypothetical protein
MLGGRVDFLDLRYGVSVKATAMATLQRWFWRVAVWGMVILFLIPISLWYFWGFSVLIIAGKEAISSGAPPIPCLPSIISGVLALLLTAWGMAALWWLALRHEHVSLRRIPLVWLLGLIAGTSTAVYYLVEMVRSPGPDDSVFILPIGSLLFLEAMLLLRVRIAESTRRRLES